MEVQKPMNADYEAENAVSVIRCGNKKQVTTASSGKREGDGGAHEYS